MDDATSESELGDGLDDAEVGTDELTGGDEDGSASELELAHAVTATNISVPVAQEINPSRTVMALVPLLSPFGLRHRRHPAGGACIVWTSS